MQLPVQNLVFSGTNDHIESLKQLDSPTEIEKTFGKTIYAKKFLTVDNERYLLQNRIRPSSISSNLQDVISTPLEIDKKLQLSKQRN